MSEELATTFSPTFTESSLPQSLRLLRAAQADDADVSLYGAQLQAWRDWVEDIRARDFWLWVALFMTRVTVALALPVGLVGALVSIPFRMLARLTDGRSTLLLTPLRLVLLEPSLIALVATSRWWRRRNPLRPLSILLMPVPLFLALVLTGLIPDDADARTNRQLLCQIWPLTEHRLLWLDTYGNG